MIRGIYADKKALECLSLAMKRSSSHVRGASGLPPAPDVGGTPGERLSLTRSRGSGADQRVPLSVGFSRCR